MTVRLWGFRLRIHFHARIKNPRGQVPRFDPQKISCLSNMRFSGHCVNRGEFSRNTKVMVGLWGFRLRIHFHARIKNPRDRSPRFDPQKISCLSDMRFSGRCVNRGEFSRNAKVMVGLCGFRLRIHFHARINNPRGQVPQVRSPKDLMPE